MAKLVVKHHVDSPQDQKVLDLPSSSVFIHLPIQRHPKTFRPLVTASTQRLQCSASHLLVTSLLTGPRFAMAPRGSPRTEKLHIQPGYKKHMKHHETIFESIIESWQLRFLINTPCNVSTILDKTKPCVENDLFVTYFDRPSPWFSITTKFTCKFHQHFHCQSSFLLALNPTCLVASRCGCNPMSAQIHLSIISWHMGK